MKHLLKISGSPFFRGSLLPFRSFEEISDRLLREIELVDIEIPEGTITRDRKQFTPIQEAYYKASHFVDREEWSQALKAIENLIELHPPPAFLSAIYTMMGTVHARLRNQDAAIRAFDQAIKLNSNDVFAHLFLGTSLMLSNKYEEAIVPIKKALELESRLAHGNFYLAYVYAKLEKWDEAIAAYNAEIETHPKSPEAYQELARLYVNLGDDSVDKRDPYYLKAIETFTKWIEVAPEAANTHNLIGYLYMMLGKREAAIEAFENAVTVDPNHILALFNLGTAYLEADRDQEARDIFEDILQLGEPGIREQLASIAPNVDAAVRLSIAEAHQKLGAACLKVYQAQAATVNSGSTFLSQAEKAFKCSLEYSPDDIHSLYNLGITHYMMGCRVAAIREFRKVLEIEPNNEETAKNLRVAEEELEKIRHWLGSKVWKRLESATDQSPVYSRDLVEEIAKAQARIFENIDASHQVDAFTSDDLLHALLPLMEYIPSAEAIADLTVTLFLHGWLSSAQAAKLAGTDLAAFLAHSYLAGVPFDKLANEANGISQDHQNSLIEALKEVLELQPTDERARDELDNLLQHRLDEKLQELGLLKDVKEPITDFTPYMNRTLIPAGRKPLSDIVVEDRR